MTDECAADPESSDYEELNEYCLLLDYIECLSAVEYGICINWATSGYCGEAPDMGAYEYCESGIYDECGVCDGDNSPNTGICDCGGIPYGDTFEDCAGVCDGDAVVDGCGVCEGNNSTCTNLFITNVDITLGTLDIYRMAWK